MSTPLRQHPAQPSTRLERLRTCFQVAVAVSIFGILLSSRTLSNVVAFEIEVPKADDAPAKATCSVSGLTDEFIAEYRDLSPRSAKWKDWFSIHVVQDGKPSETAMTGKYAVDGQRITFSPRFPFRAGVPYVARVKLPDEAPQLVRFGFKRRATVPTTVQQVYPSGASIHENHLRFYIQFSQPISRGGVYEHIELRDEKGKLVEAPFLTLDEELWDQQQRRLTLLFDPGRVKRELLPRQELGPAILTGHKYTLHVLDSLLDANGNPIVAYKKHYKVLPPDSTQPNEKRWQVTPPPSANSPLKITFDESLDWGLLNRVVTIVDGSIAVGKEERSWTFKTQEPWEQGRYEIVIDTRLEDPAGNSIGRPFEVDMLRAVERQIRSKTVSLSFVVR
jgi:hypothetical protein